MTNPRAPSSSSPFHRLPSLLAALLALTSSGVARAETALPASGMLAWASNREQGRHEIYVMKLAGGTPTRVSRLGGQQPSWSPDGGWIAYFHGGDSTTHVVRWDGSGDRQVCPGYPMFWMHDGSGVVCAVLKTDWAGWEYMSRSDEYLLAHPELGTVVPLFKRSDFTQLADGPGPMDMKHLVPGGITQDGRWLVGWVFGMFERGYTADNGRFVTEQASVILDLLDPKKLYYLGPGCTTTTPPDGNLVYQVSREGLSPPDIFSLDLADVTTRQSYKQVVGRPDAEWGHDYFPRISNDGRYLVYAASQGCHPWYECDYEVFLHELGKPLTESARLTTHPGNDNYPALYVGQPWQAEPAVARIGLTPERLNLFGSTARAPAAQKVVVWSAAGMPLGPITARVPEAADARWLQVTVMPVKEGQAELALTMDAASLPSGNHTARVEVSVPGAVNSPRMLEVRLSFTSSNTPPVSDGGVDGAAGPDGATIHDGASVDATVAANDGPAPSADAPGTQSGGSGGGCDCTAGGRASASLAAPLLLALAGLGWAGRSRRRRRLLGPA